MDLTDAVYGYRAHVVRVIDGDTCVLDVQLGFDVAVRQTCRLFGVNAPELKTPAGQAAKTWLEGQLPAGQAVFIRTVRDQTEKFGRTLATIHRSTAKMQADDLSVNELIVQANLAVPYFGGKRT